MEIPAMILRTQSRRFQSELDKRSGGNLLRAEGTEHNLGECKDNGSPDHAPMGREVQTPPRDLLTALQVEMPGTEDPKWEQWAETTKNQVNCLNETTKKRGNKSVL